MTAVVPEPGRSLADLVGAEVRETILSSIRYRPVVRTSGSRLSDTQSYHALPSRGGLPLRPAQLERRTLPADRTMAKPAVTSAIVAAAVTAAAFLLNPSPEQHRDKIKEAIAERSPLAGALGIGALTAFTSTYHPLGIASYTTINERTVSIGALGMVFVLQPEQEK